MKKDCGQGSLCCFLPIGESTGLKPRTHGFILTVLASFDRIRAIRNTGIKGV